MLFGSIELPGRPDLLNILALDLLPIPQICRMMQVGVAIDVERLGEISEILAAKMSELELEITSYIPPAYLNAFLAESGDDIAINVDSAEQIAELLFKALKLGEGKDLKRTPSGLRISTGKKQLEKLKRDHPVIPKILEYREASKLKSTYADALPLLAKDENGVKVVRTQLLTTRTSTGRLACAAWWTPVRTRAYGFLPIRDIEVGDYVWTHQRRWRKVTATWRKGIAPMYNVSFSNGHILTCTGDHKLLLSGHERVKTVGEQPSECSGSTGATQISRISYDKADSQEIRDYLPQHTLDLQESRARGRIQSPKGDPVLTVQAGGEKSHDRQDRRSAPQLDRLGIRWTRVSDLFEGWQKAVCSQGGDGGSLGAGPITGGFRCSSYRQQQDEQSIGQSGSGYNTWTQENTLPSGEGLALCHVEKIEAAGSFEVYDISVDEDESYEACGVFSHNSKRPNLQNIPTRTKLGQMIRKAFIARPGCRLVSVDYSQIELRLLADRAHERKMIQVFESGGDIHTETAMRAFGIDDPAKVDKISQRNPCKNINFGVCIAWGQRVLTNHGLIPIQNVSCHDMVWDGEEFVHHEGVVYKGIKRVITYRGLTATPDHKVWVQDGRKIPLSQAMAEGSELAVTGLGEHPVRYAPGGVKDLPGRQKSLQVRQDDVYGLPQDQRGIGRQSAGGQESAMQVPTGQIPRSESPCIAGTLLGYVAALHQPKEPKLAQLWRSRDRVQVSEPGAFHKVHVALSAAPDISRSGYWTERQQWPLRAGEFRTRDALGKRQQHAAEQMGVLQESSTDYYSVVHSASKGLPMVSPDTWHDEAFSRSGNHLAGDPVPLSQKTPVYDIYNAGPRRRFTVEGKLVSNCYGLTASGLYDLMAVTYATASLPMPDWLDIEWCERFIEKWFNLYPDALEYFQLQHWRARRYEMVWDMFGRTRLVPEVRSQLERVQYAGLRQAGNLPIQAAAAGVMKIGMARVERVLEGIRASGIYAEALLPVHDELLIEVDAEWAEEVEEVCRWEMEQALVDESGELRCRVPIKTEGSIMTHWAKAA